MDGLPGQYHGWLAQSVSWIAYPISIMDGLPDQYHGWLARPVSWMAYPINIMDGLLNRPQYLKKHEKNRHLIRDYITGSDDGFLILET